MASKLKSFLFENVIHVSQMLFIFVVWCFSFTYLATLLTTVADHSLCFLIVFMNSWVEICWGSTFHLPSLHTSTWFRFAKCVYTQTVFIEQERGRDWEQCTKQRSVIGQFLTNSQRQQFIRQHGRSYCPTINLLNTLGCSLSLSKAWPSNQYST